MQKGEYTLDELADKVCEFMEIDKELIWESTRKQEVVAVRRSIAIVGHYYLEYELKDIVSYFDLHHSTVIHYLKLSNIDNNTLNAIRYLLNDVEFDEISILALKVSKYPKDKELRLKLKQLL